MNIQPASKSEITPESIKTQANETCTKGESTAGLGLRIAHKGLL